MKVSYIKNKNIACLEFDTNDKRAEFIIAKLNLIAWDIVEQVKGKVLFSVEDKEDFESLKRFVNHYKSHDIYL